MFLGELSLRGRSLPAGGAGRAAAGVEAAVVTSPGTWPLDSEGESVVGLAARLALSGALC